MSKFYWCLSNWRIQGSTTFLEELAEAFANAYWLGIANCKDKVTQAFLELDPSKIIDIELKEQEQDANRVVDTKEVEVANTKVVAEAHIAEAIADTPEADSIEAPEGLIAKLKA